MTDVVNDDGELLDDEFGEVTDALLQAERPKKLAENVAARLLNYMTTRELAPGTPLASQKWLLENLDVGRASLREALRFLEIHGFVELRAGRNGGPVVGDVSSKNFARMSSMYFHALGVTVREVMDARAVLEPAMVRAIADRGLTIAEASQLRRFASPGHGAGGHGNSPVPPSHDFHWGIADLSGNAVLRLVAESTAEIYQGVAREVTLTPEEQQEIEVVHQEIAEAILAGEGPTAQARMAQHLRHIVATYEQKYRHLLTARISWP